MRNRKIIILSFLFGISTIIPACLYTDTKQSATGEKNTPNAALISQTSNMVILKIQILAYVEKYGKKPDTIEMLNLPPYFKNSIDIKNIKYPDDKFLFYEKESREYGSLKGKFFVHKDGFVEFVPTGSAPQKRPKPL